MTAIILTLIIFFITLFFVIWGKIPRVISCFGGAMAMVFLGERMHFYSQKEALLEIDFNTIGLLLGMMIVVAMLRRSGFLTYLAIRTAKFSKGSPFRLMILLGFVTAFLSMLIDNVTTLIIVGPMTILIADMLGFSPIPYLIAEVVFSNLGGVATLVGDPPNIMIATAADFSFNDFLVHLLPLVILTLIVAAFVFRIIFWKDLKARTEDFEAIVKMDEKRALLDRSGMRRSLFALGIIFLLFFLEKMLHLKPSFIALFGASIALLIIRPNPDDILKEVEWPLLIFFASLFVLVGGVERTGLFTRIAEQIGHLANYSLTGCSIAFLWFSAVTSAFCGNITFVASIIPVVKQIPLAGRQLETIWWVLAVGVGYGGNALPISSAAGILCITICERAKRSFSIKRWLKTATLMTFLSLVFVSLFVLFAVHLFF